MAPPRRLGWNYCGGLCSTSDTGGRIDLAEDAPQFVKLMARRSVRRYRKIAEAFHGMGIGRNSLITKAVDVAAKTPGKSDPLAPHWTGGCASALRSAVSNGQWPQVRLRSARLADSDRCQLCQVEKGTIANRRIYIASENIRCHAAVPKHVEAVVNELAEAQKK